jgi:5-methylthioadenosine/S-adenosylhomocysteine deaminase
MVDFLVKGGLVYTMDPRRRVLSDGAVAVDGDRIVAVGGSSELESTYAADRVIDAEGMAVLPGFVDVHTHLPSIFVRGVYGVIREGLYQVLFPVKEYLEPGHIHALGLASCMEALFSGITTVQETYNYMAEFAGAALETGIRVDLGEQIAEADYQAIKDGVYRYLPGQAEVMIRRAKALKEDWDGATGGRITVSWAPLAPDMCTPWVYEEVMGLQRPGEKVSTHVEQSAREVEQVRRLYGKTSVEHLDDMGVLGPDLIGAHCIHNDDNDLRLMKGAGASILHCPRPYLLGGSTVPLARWMWMGLKVGLGTDNVHHTMWETMRAAFYGARLRETLGEPRCPGYYDFLELATRKGAEVMGLEDSVGSLEPGKKADLQLVNLRSPNIMPTADFTSSLVLYGSPVNVDTVMVDGKVVKEEGRVVTVDERQSLLEAQSITEKLWENLFHDRPRLRDLTDA